MKYIYILLFVTLIGCGNNSPSPTKHDFSDLRKSPLHTKDKKYYVELFVGKVNKEDKFPVWVPKIFSSDNSLIFQDTNCHFSGYHSSYWQWNSKNEFFLLSSDSGELLKYRIIKNEWNKEIIPKENLSLSQHEFPKLLLKKLSTYPVWNEFAK